MKRIALLLTLSFLFSVANAQNDPVFIFEQFQNGKIHFKNRSVTIVPMNYDAVNDKMYFKRDGNLMELVNLAAVDSVSWGRKVCFICHNGTFMEKVKLQHGNVFIRWRVKSVNIGSRGALGSITQAKVDRVYSEGNKGHNNADVYRLQNTNDYYLLLEGKYQKASTLKQILKLFPDQRTAIEAFVEQKQTDFHKPISVLELLNYCLSIHKQTP